MAVALLLALGSGGVCRGLRSGTAVSCLPGLQHKTEREWLFEILRQGMRDRHCYELCARRGVFHIVLSFFNSPLCDDEAQVGGAHSLSEHSRAVLLLKVVGGGGGL